MRVFSAFLLLLSLSVISSCDTNSTGTSGSSLQVVAEPAEGGSVEAGYNKLSAKAKPGFIFRYWEIHNTDGTITTLTQDTAAVQSESIKEVTGVFGLNNIESPLDIKAGSNERYAYYATDFIMPEDTSKRKVVYAVIRADLENRTKQKVFITDKRIRNFDVSANERFIAFSSYDTGDFSNTDVETYIYDLKDEELSSIFTGGVKQQWANNSNQLLIGSQNKVCIYDLDFGQCRNLTIPETSFTNTKGFLAASWSPDDKHLLLSRDTDPFYLYDTETLSREVLNSETQKNYFIWLDNNSFVTGGNDVGKHTKNGLEYSLQDLSNPDVLSFEANFIPVSSSPSKKRFAFINYASNNNGINIYDHQTDEAKNILNFYKFDPIIITWVKENEMLFYGRNEQVVYRLTPQGEVLKL